MAKITGAVYFIIGVCTIVWAIEYKSPRDMDWYCAGYGMCV